MTTPVLLGQRVFNSPSFSSTVDSTGEPIDFGSGAGRWIQVLLYTDNNGVNLNSVTVGGNTLTAETQVATPTGGAGNGRSFRLQGDGVGAVPTGVATVTGTSSSSAGRLQMIVSWGHTSSAVAVATYTGPGGVNPTFTATPTTTDDLAVVHGITSANTVLGGNAWTAPYVQFAAASGSTLGDIQVPNAGQLHAWALNETGGASSTLLGLAITDNQYTPASAGWAVVVSGSVAAPTVTTQPSSTTVQEPAPGTFTAAFSNSPTSYAWEFADSPYSSWSTVVGGSGAATASYTTAASTAGITGRRYRCTATNAGGSITTNESAELTVTPLIAPSITVQPTNQAVTGPTAATFSLTATGSPAPTYQWQRNPGGNTSFADIGGATLASYTTPATSVTGGTANNGDTYRCNVTNAASTVTSNVVTLSVAAPVDGVAPVMTGVLAESAITTNSYSLSWSAATDNMSVTGYQLSLNGGTTWFPVGNVLTYAVTGRTPGSTDSCRVRAYDPTTNLSNELTTSVTLQSTTLVTDPLENFSGSLHLGTTINYSWFPGGRIGSLAGITPVEGTGTTHATTGALTVPNLELGSGVILTCARDTSAATDGVHYQALTVTAV